MRIRSAALILPFVALASAGGAQVTPPAGDAAGNATTALPPPILPTVTPTPAPSAPLPTATPTGAASPVPVPVQTSTAIPTPRPSATSTRRVAVPPVSPPASAPPPGRPEPSPSPSPSASPDVPPRSYPEIEVATRPAPAPANRGAWWLAGVGLLALAFGGWLIARRRSREDDSGAGVEERGSPEPIMMPATVPPSMADPHTSATAAPSIAYRPARIGLNLVTATVEGEVAVTNAGTEPIADVRVRAILLGAAAGHEAAVGVFHREASGRALAPPFALAPGETRTLRAVVAAPRGGIEPLTVAGRPMFVPLVAVGIEWRHPGGVHRRTQAYAVGIERVDSPKLAPVWLDQDSRMYDTVAARLHGPVIG